MAWSRCSTGPAWPRSDSTTHAAASCSASATARGGSPTPTGTAKTASPTSHGRSTSTANPATTPASCSSTRRFRSSNPGSAAKLLGKRLGLRTKMNVVPLDTGLVKGSHGRAPERPDEGPLWVGPHELAGAYGAAAALRVAGRALDLGHDSVLPMSIWRRACEENQRSVFAPDGVTTKVSLMTRP